jgi:hypothetical protein
MTIELVCKEAVNVNLALGRLDRKFVFYTATAATYDSTISITVDVNTYCFFTTLGARK